MSARSRSSSLTGWRWTLAWPSRCVNVSGAIHRQVSQSMQLASTKKSPEALCSSRRSNWAMAQYNLVSNHAPDETQQNE